MPEKRLIVIYPTCPSGFGGGGQRWTQFEKEFSKAGWRTVFVDPHGDVPERIENEDSFDMKVLVVAQPRPGTAAALLSYKERGFICAYDLVDDWTALNDGWYQQRVEASLIKEAHVVFVTCPALSGYASSHGAMNVVVVPNAGDADIFIPTRHFIRYPVRIGYFGSVWGGWFNWRLIRDLAMRRPDWQFEIVGQHSFYKPDGVTVVCESTAKQELEKQSNIILRGIIPHGDLPRVCSKWTAAVIPFKRMKVTDCTDPVKAYEYLLGGLPVVSIRFDSLLPLNGNGLTMIADEKADDASAWEEAIAVTKPPHLDHAGRRKLTWSDRYDRFVDAVKAISIRKEAEQVRVERLRFTTKTVSVVIPSWKDADQLKPLLESLKAQTLKPAEVIVVDNLSGDGTKEMVLEQGGRIIEAECNISAARNIGAKAVKSDLIAFTDCGCRLSPEWLEKMAEAHRPGAIVGSVIFNMRYPEDPLRDEIGKITYANGQTGNLEGFLPSGSSMMMRPADFIHAGGFDEDLYNGEDTEFDFRAIKKGIRIIAIRDRLVEHHVLKNLRDLFVQYFKYGSWDWIANRERDIGYDLMARSSLSTPLTNSPVHVIQTASALGWMIGKNCKVVDASDPRPTSEHASKPGLVSFLRSNRLKIVNKRKVLLVSEIATSDSLFPPLVSENEVQVASVVPVREGGRRWYSFSMLSKRNVASDVVNAIRRFGPAVCILHEPCSHEFRIGVEAIIRESRVEYNDLVKTRIVTGEKLS